MAKSNDFKILGLKKGSKVAILSPSNGLPGVFPWVQDLGLERLRDVFHLEPVEYPTTRQMGSALQDRANDIMSAFANPEIKAVFTSIGGNDAIPAHLPQRRPPSVLLDQVEVRKIEVAILSNIHIGT